MSSSIKHTDIIIAVVGATGCGKSTFISKCTGQRVEVNDGLSSCTNLVEPFTFRRNGYNVHLIDTPGFDNGGMSDAALLEEVAACLNHAYLSGFQISGVIYLQPINVPRMQGSIIRILRIIQKICGPEASSSILLGSTMWDKEDFDIAERREEELTGTTHFWGTMIEEGSKTFRFFNEQSSALIACDYFIERNIKVTLALQHQMVNERKMLNETDAGMELEKDILHLKRLCQSNMASAREEAELAILTNNETAVTALIRTQNQLEVDLSVSQSLLESMHGDMEALQIQSENQLQTQLRQLRWDEQQDQLLLEDRESYLVRLDGIIRDLEVDIATRPGIIDLEEEYTRTPTDTFSALDRVTLFAHTTTPLTSRESSESVHFFGERITPRTTSEESTHNPALTIEEIRAVFNEYNECKGEIDLCKERKELRHRKIETCVVRLGVGAGVVGTAFQTASFAAMMGGCNIM